MNVSIATAGNATPVIKDFNTAEGDSLDLSLLLSGVHPTQATIDNWPVNVGSGAAGGLLLAWYGVWLANLTEDHPTHAGLRLGAEGLNAWRLPWLGQSGAKAPRGGSEWRGCGKRPGGHRRRAGGPI